MSEFYEIPPGVWAACPMGDCKKTSRGWKPTEVHCSSCGTHAGAMCPKCDAVIDLGHHDLGEMIAAAVPPHRPALGAYCSNGHTVKPVMYCDDCKVIWSPCCSEKHECGVVAENGALYPVHADRVFRRGSRVKVIFNRETHEIASVSSLPGLDPLDGWTGWEG